MNKQEKNLKKNSSYRPKMYSSAFICLFFLFLAIQNYLNGLTGWRLIFNIVETVCFAFLLITNLWLLHKVKKNM